MDELDQKIRKYRNREGARRTVLQRALVSIGAVVGGVLLLSQLKSPPSFGDRGISAKHVGDPEIPPRSAGADKAGIIPHARIGGDSAKFIGAWSERIVTEKPSILEVLIEIELRADGTFKSEMGADGPDIHVAV
ncbi:MAG: hypothetical protein JWO38_930 [Gemmataceae bacterium]|nr:hypothetical protein [Gemmataceae bacterium]